MNIIRKECIGTLKLDNTVDITDPCYSKDDVWCRMTTECKAGKYTGYVEISDEDGWGERVASIAIYKDNVIKDIDSMQEIGIIEVDAGLAGFFNNKPDYSDDLDSDEWDIFLRETEALDISKNYYRCDYGLFTSSGGDGAYSVYATPERDAFLISFIYDYDEEEE